MKIKYLFIGLLALTSCQQQDLTEQLVPQPTSNNIVMYAENFDFGTSTRAGFVIAGQNAGFTWTPGDVVGVFPVATDQNQQYEGTQVSFPLTEDVVKKNYAEFDGGGWGLRNDYSYVAYYPLQRNWNTDKKQIEISYENQVFQGVQTNENGNTVVNFNGYDYLTAQVKKATANAKLQFRFQHVGALVILAIPIPYNHDCKEIILKNNTSGEEIFTLKGTLDLTQTPVNEKGEPLAQEITPTYKSNQFGVKTIPGKAASGNSLDKEFYFQMPPTALKDKRLQVIVTLTNTSKEESKDTTTVYVPYDLKAGGGYYLQAQSFTPGEYNTYGKPGTLHKQMGDDNPESVVLSCNINNDDIAHLSTLSNLSSLNLRYAKVGEGYGSSLGPKCFKGFKHLTKLYLPTDPLSINYLAFEGLENSENCTLYISKNWKEFIKLTPDNKIEFHGAFWKDICESHGNSLVEKDIDPSINIEPWEPVEGGSLETE